MADAADHAARPQRRTTAIAAADSIPGHAAGSVLQLFGGDEGSGSSHESDLDLDLPLTDDDSSGADSDAASDDDIAEPTGTTLFEHFRNDGSELSSESRRAIAAIASLPAVAALDDANSTPAPAARHKYSALFGDRGPLLVNGFQARGEYCWRMLCAAAQRLAHSPH